MGLVVQATPDPMLALPAPAGQQSAEPSGVPEAFEALFTELLGGQGAEIIAVTAPAQGQGDPAQPAPTNSVADDSKERSKSEALLAALANLQAPGIATAAPEANAAADTARETAPTAAAVSESVPGPSASAPVATTVDAAEEPDAPAPEAGAPAEPAAVQIDTAPGVAPADAKAHSDASGKTVLPPGMFEAVLKGRREHVEHVNRGGKPDPADPTDSAPDAAPPGNSPPVTQAPASSVVRSVGNADEQNTTGDDDGHRQEPGKPQPRASVEGVQHSSDHSVLHRTAEADAAAPADAPEAPARPELPEAVRQVVRAVVEQAGRDGGEARLHLRPENLGDVVVRVHTNGDAVRLEIHADRPEAVQLLREHTVDLSSMLGNRGLNLGEVYVALGGQQGRDTRDERPSSPSNRPGNRDFAALMGIGESAASDRFNRLRAAYNPDGAHLYRV